jgi:hypothetical protein
MSIVPDVFDISKPVERVWKEVRANNDDLPRSGGGCLNGSIYWLPTFYANSWHNNGNFRSHALKERENFDFHLLKTTCLNDQH